MFLGLNEKQERDWKEFFNATALNEPSLYSLSGVLLLTKTNAIIPMYSNNIVNTIVTTVSRGSELSEQTRKWSECSKASVANERSEWCKQMNIGRLACEGGI